MSYSLIGRKYQCDEYILFGIFRVVVVIGDRCLLEKGFLLEYLGRGAVETEDAHSKVMPQVMGKRWSVYLKVS